MKPAVQLRVASQPWAMTAPRNIPTRIIFSRRDGLRSGMVFEKAGERRRQLLFEYRGQGLLPAGPPVICWRQSKGQKPPARRIFSGNSCENSRPRPAFTGLCRWGLFSTLPPRLSARRPMHEIPTATLHFDPPYEGLIGGTIPPGGLGRQ